MESDVKELVKTSNLKPDAPCFESKLTLVKDLSGNKNPATAGSERNEQDQLRNSKSSDKYLNKEGRHRDNFKNYYQYNRFNNFNNTKYHKNNDQVLKKKFETQTETCNADEATLINYHNDTSFSKPQESHNNVAKNDTQSFKKYNNNFQRYNANGRNTFLNSSASDDVNWRLKPNSKSKFSREDRTNDENNYIDQNSDGMHDNLENNMNRNNDISGFKNDFSNKIVNPTNKRFFLNNKGTKTDNKFNPSLNYSDRNNFRHNQHYKQNSRQNNNKINKVSNADSNDPTMKDKNLNETNVEYHKQHNNPNQNNYGARPKEYSNQRRQVDVNEFVGDNKKQQNNWVRSNQSGKTYQPHDDDSYYKNEHDDDDVMDHSVDTKANDESQRGLLEQQLTKGTYECMVCCSAVKKDVAIWHCSTCYHIYHLYCIKKWANTSYTQFLSNSTQSQQLGNGSAGGSGNVTGGDNKGWRCPACQNLTLAYPDKNLCFCGKQVDPPYSGYWTPHSCGDMCGKKRNANCKHPCNIPCHPEWTPCRRHECPKTCTKDSCPCPPCNALVNVTCDCGKMKSTAKCSASLQIKCQETCNKTLNCGVHNCVQVCHKSACAPCEIEVQRSCHCGQLNKQVVCGSKDYFISSYSCGQTCGKPLNCGNHTCTTVCHQGPCEECKLVPSLVTHCPCGKTQLDELKSVTGKNQQEKKVKTSSMKKKDLRSNGFEDGEEEEEGNIFSKNQDKKVKECEKHDRANNDDNANSNNISNVRTSCLDPIPCCWKKCNKELECGDPGTPHRCKSKCHIGPCPECPDNMTVPCRCLTTNKVLTCKEFMELRRHSLPIKCDNRCGKKMLCGRHRCSQNCCIDDKHLCTVICGYKLTCGLHKCEEVCHKGKCLTCWRASFEELTCECGSEVIYPPVPCGTKPPLCLNLCRRAHSCHHPVQHVCHSEPTCPPCTVLSLKMCMCGREKRENVPCFLQDVSCGHACGKPLPCRVHSCAQLCHKPPCLDGGKLKCTQPCPVPRPGCNHPCMAPCHVGQSCPPTKCKAMVVVRCECGRREEKMVCLVDQKLETKDDYSHVAASLVASQLWNAQSIDLSILKDVKIKNRLPCDSACGIERRNKALAEALNIENPIYSSEVSSIGFSDFLKDFARQNIKFVAEIEEILIQIVKDAHNSKGGRKVYSFKSMPSIKRRIIHELAQQYLVTTESIDEEPKRSVVATAIKNVSRLLPQSLTSLTKHGHHPRAPIPIPANYDEDKLRSLAQAAKQSTSVKTSTSKGNNDDGDGDWKTIGSKNKKMEPVIDYFDFPS